MYDLEPSLTSCSFNADLLKPRLNSASTTPSNCDPFDGDICNANVLIRYNTADFICVNVGI
jgi:hypothetical protein